MIPVFLVQLASYMSPANRVALTHPTPRPSFFVFLRCVLRVAVTTFLPCGSADREVARRIMSGPPPVEIYVYGPQHGGVSEADRQDRLQRGAFVAGVVVRKNDDKNRVVHTKYFYVFRGHPIWSSLLFR